MKNSEKSTGNADNDIQRINIDLPMAILNAVDGEAERIGVTRTSLIKIWISAQVDKISHRRAK